MPLPSGPTNSLIHIREALTTFVDASWRTVVKACICIHQKLKTNDKRKQNSYMFGFASVISPHAAFLYFSCSRVSISSLSLTVAISKPHTSSEKMSISTMFLVFIVVFVRSSQSSKLVGPTHQLSVDFYSKTCPQLEQLVASVTSQQFHDAPVSAPATIRLFFHDCFVQVPFNTIHNLLMIRKTCDSWVR